MILASVSAFTIFYVGAAVIGLAVGALAWRLLFPAAPRIPNTSPLWGTAPDDARWEDEALEQRHAGLAAIRDSAAKWGASISALLGVFAVVAFVKGPTTFTGLTGDKPRIAALLVILAAALAAAAVLLAALAAQGSATRLSLLDGWALRALTASRLTVAARQLAWSRVLTVFAALLVLLAVGLTWLAALRQQDTTTTEPRFALLTRGPGQHAVCGRLTSTPTGLRLTPDAGAARDVVAPAQLTVVSRCR